MLTRTEQRPHFTQSDSQKYRGRYC